MIYLLDTNTISDMIMNHPNVIQQVENHLINRDRMAICQPVYYELMRGLIRTHSEKKMSILRDKLIPKFEWIRLQDDDWLQAAQLWTAAMRIGRQLSDMDFLLAALAHRLNAVVVSSDADFDALPIQRENWRDSTP